MSDEKKKKKLSDLPLRLSSEIVGNEVIPIVYLGEAYRLTLDELKTFIGVISGGSVDLTKVGSHVLPKATNTYDVGNAALHWRSLYAGSVNANTIYLGNTGFSLREADDKLHLTFGSNLTEYVATESDVKALLAQLEGKADSLSVLELSQRVGSVESKANSNASKINTLSAEATTTAKGLMSAADKRLLDKLGVFYESTDSDDVINKWIELEKFLEGLKETDSLATITAELQGQIDGLWGRNSFDDLFAGHVAADTLAAEAIYTDKVEGGEAAFGSLNVSGDASVSKNLEVTGTITENGQKLAHYSFVEQVNGIAVEALNYGHAHQEWIEGTYKRDYEYLDGEIVANYKLHKALEERVDELDVDVSANITSIASLDSRVSANAANLDSKQIALKTQNARYINLDSQGNISINVDGVGLKIYDGSTSYLYVDTDVIAKRDWVSKTLSSALADYLPLSGGGTVTGDTIVPLMLKSPSSAGQVLLQYYRGDDYWGALGFNASDSPIFKSVGGTQNELIHSGNIENYAPHINAFEGLRDNVESYHNQVLKLSTKVDSIEDWVGDLEADYFEVKESLPSQFGGLWSRNSFDELFAGHLATDTIAAERVYADEINGGTPITSATINSTFFTFPNSGLSLKLGTFITTDEYGIAFDYESYANLILGNIVSDVKSWVSGNYHPLITSNSKLSYSLIDGTPDMSLYAKDTELRWLMSEVSTIETTVEGHNSKIIALENKIGDGYITDGDLDEYKAEVNDNFSNLLEALNKVDDEVNALGTSVSSLENTVAGKQDKLIAARHITLDNQGNMSINVDGVGLKIYDGSTSYLYVDTDVIAKRDWVSKTLSSALADYLPLSGGGTVTGDTIVPLMLKSPSSAGQVLLQYYRGDDYWGALGFNASDSPIFKSVGGTQNELIHSGNIENYAPHKDAFQGLYDNVQSYQNQVLKLSTKVDLLDAWVTDLEAEYFESKDELQGQINGLWSRNSFDELYAGHLMSDTIAAEKVYADEINGGTPVTAVNNGITLNGKKMVDATYSNNTWISAHEIRLTNIHANEDAYLTFSSSVVGLRISTSIYVDGAVSQASDARKKDIVGDIELTTSQIANAPAVEFYWKNGDHMTKNVGTIAQYWQETLPSVVNNMGDSLAIDYATLGVVSSIVLAREVEILKRRIEELERALSCER